MKKSLLLALLFFGSLSFSPVDPPLLTTKWTSTPTGITLSISKTDPSFSNILLEWELQVNGVIRQKGKKTGLIVTPRQPAILHLPVKVPTAADAEAFLLVRYR